jgi:hypothetical protein
MMNRPDDELHSILTEAVNRLRFAVKLLDGLEDRHVDEPKYGGYDYAVTREIIEDVVAGLAATADLEDQSIRRAVR